MLVFSTFNHTTSLSDMAKKDLSNKSKCVSFTAHFLRETVKKAIKDRQMDEYQGIYG